MCIWDFNYFSCKDFNVLAVDCSNLKLVLTVKLILLIRGVWIRRVSKFPWICHELGMPWHFMESYGHLRLAREQ